MAPLVRADLELTHYRRVLRTMWWIHVPLQEMFASALEQAGAAYMLADRVGWLQTDLAHFDMAKTFMAHSWQPPIPGSLAALTGMLYVIEGSTLGGQVIARQLAERMNLGPESGARFFHGWGTETRQHWCNFWRFAEAACPPAQVMPATAAACLLFERLHAAFDKALSWEDDLCS